MILQAEFTGGSFRSEFGDMAWTTDRESPRTVNPRRIVKSLIRL